MLKTIMFDLDGTLLPMDQDVFAKSYFKHLAAKLTPFGYDPKKLIADVWAGTAAMVKNDGPMTNEDVFWITFRGIYGDKADTDKQIFDEFYRVEFQNVAADCGRNPASKEIVKKLKEMGFRLVLATNPIFPSTATESRIRWAGLDPNDFDLITTYENSTHCKPNPEYYRDIFTILNLNPTECLMVGNDVDEDMIAKTVGSDTFLLTDCLINKSNKDISCYPNGSFPALLDYILKNK